MNIRRFQCSVCKREYRDKSHLQRHSKVCDTICDAKKTTRPVHKYSCEICKKDFKVKKYYTQHMEGMHSGKKNYVCECGKSFSWRGSLANHKKNCEEEVQKKLNLDVFI